MERTQNNREPDRTQADHSRQASSQEREVARARHVCSRPHCCLAYSTESWVSARRSGTAVTTSGPLQRGQPVVVLEPVIQAEHSRAQNSSAPPAPPVSLRLACGLVPCRRRTCSGRWSPDPTDAFAKRTSEALCRSQSIVTSFQLALAASGNAPDANTTVRAATAWGGRSTSRRTVPLRKPTAAAPRRAAMPPPNARPGRRPDTPAVPSPARPPSHWHVRRRSAPASPSAPAARPPVPAHTRSACDGLPRQRVVGQQHRQLASAAHAQASTVSWLPSTGSRSSPSRCSNSKAR